jgi:hypothetical protein
MACNSLYIIGRAQGNQGNRVTWSTPNDDLQQWQTYRPASQQPTYLDLKGEFGAFLPDYRYLPFTSPTPPTHLPTHLLHFVSSVQSFSLFPAGVGVVRRLVVQGGYLLINYFTWNWVGRVEAGEVEGVLGMGGKCPKNELPLTIS